MTNSSMTPLMGVNVIGNRLVKSVPDYGPPRRFRVGVTTTNCSWTDTELNNSVDITPGSKTKQLESTVLDEVNGNVVFHAWLSVTEANGNLLTGLAVVNEDTTEKLITKSKFSGVSKTNTELFKFTVKIKMRDSTNI